MKQANEKAHANAIMAASVARAVGQIEEANATGVYTAECYDKDGNLKWRDTYKNLVVTQGKNDALDKYLSGATYTAAWYLGLISSVGYSNIVAGDTAASHAGWTESSAYAAANRPTVSFAAAASGSKTTSAAVSFAINAAGTIKGSFLISNNTKGGTTGILYSAGLFTGGDKVVDNGDTLNVTYTASL